MPTLSSASLRSYNTDDDAIARINLYHGRCAVAVCTRNYISHACGSAAAAAVCGVVVGLAQAHNTVRVENELWERAVAQLNDITMRRRRAECDSVRDESPIHS